MLYVAPDDHPNMIASTVDPAGALNGLVIMFPPL
jgi:hypothetical protein